MPEIESLQGYSNGSKITLSQLASHTSGLNREPDMPAWAGIGAGHRHTLYPNGATKDIYAAAHGQYVF
jgi:CubicO group peptidase (beta-lactamase class C family)